MIRLIFLAVGLMCSVAIVCNPQSARPDPKLILLPHRVTGVDVNHVVEVPNGQVRNQQKEAG
jgi:hypothetical protein